MYTALVVGDHSSKSYLIYSAHPVVDTTADVAAEGDIIFTLNKKKKMILNYPINYVMPTRVPI